jgi:hypothetical protein
MKVFLFRADSLKSTKQAGAQPYGKVWKISRIKDLPFYAPVVFAFLVSYARTLNNILLSSFLTLPI